MGKWGSRLLGAAAGLFIWATSLAQVDSIALNYAGTITIDDLQRHLKILASDEYEGRDTGKEGQKKAAAYLRARFIEYGIPPVPAEEGVIVEGYFQPFRLIEERNGTLSIATARDTLDFKDQILYFNEFISKALTVDKVLFLGDGRNIQGVSAGDVLMVVDDGVADMVPFMGWLQQTAEQARSADASMLLVSTPRIAELREELGHFIGGSRMRLANGGQRAPKTGMQTILVDKEAAASLLKGRKRMNKLRTGRRIPANFTVLATPQQQEVVSENVLAYIEGTEKPEELIVITAHYDHVGMEGEDIYNGADDDGSGTVALIEIAEAFAEAKKAGHGPKRSVLIMPVSAEEKGLLGSKYYSENPVFPLENTIANLNIDMIGRTDSAHAGGEPYVYVIGSDRLSTQLHEVNERANSSYTELELDYTFNAEDDPNKFYYRSDHYNFARKGVPAIFYFSGVHEDYHQPTDTEEKIEYDRLHQRTLLVFHTAWILANQEERIKVDKPVR